MLLVKKVERMVKEYYFDYAEGLKILREREAKKKMSKTQQFSFRNRYERVRKRSNKGERIKNVYALGLNDNGSQEVMLTGETINIYDEIQSHKDSVDVKKTLERFINTGDLSALQKVQGAYIDATEFPKTYAQFQQQLIDARNYFESLPVDIRAKFNHNPEEFFAKIGSDEFNNILGIKKEEISFTDVPTVEKPVKDGDLIE